MTEKTVRSFEDLITILQEDRYCCGHVIFRGVKNRDHKLIPSVGRISKFQVCEIHELIAYERSALGIFKQRAFSEIEKLPGNEWTWLALAQHHGLPTRLLDWTYSPLIAAYFATEPSVSNQGILNALDKNGGAIYALHDCNAFEMDNFDENPFSIDSPQIVYAPVVTNRISGQAGLFTVHPDPRKEFQEEFEDGLSESTSTKWVDKLVFSKEVAEKIQKALYFL